MATIIFAKLSVETFIICLNLPKSALNQRKGRKINQNRETHKLRERAEKFSHEIKNT